MDAERDIYIYIYNIDIYMRLLLSSQLSPPPASSREEKEEVIMVQRYCRGRRDCQRLAPLRESAREIIRDDTPVSSAHKLALRGFSLTAVEVVY